MTAGGLAAKRVSRAQEMVTAHAHPNIALAKYWGKRAYGENLPSVPSLSVTLAGMVTTTDATLSEGPDDVFVLDGRREEGRPSARVTELADRLWSTSTRRGHRPRVEVASRNDFPTAAGLASSASAFAALAVALDAALGTGLSRDRLSCLARQVSASAGRSLFGGFVELPAGQPGDEQLPAVALAPASHWPSLRVVVAVTAEGPKAVGSTEGMIRTAETSPLYGAWLEAAPRIFSEVKRAVLERDLAALGPSAEHSALTMHATAFAARPGLFYWNEGTMEVMRRIRQARADGLAAYFTIDAGPHVKVLTEADHEADVRATLTATEGVLRTIVTRPGGDAELKS